ncbi:MAG: hypothetical protein ACE5JR_03165 [Gemmatimonadota bacterium]
MTVTETGDVEDPGAQPDASEQRGAEAIEQKIRRVLHLDELRIYVQQDGRFLCKLDRPIADLEPEHAREILEKLAPVLEMLREKAEG